MSSMRNAVYVLRKIFGKDFLLEPVKDTIKINPSCDMLTDAPISLPDMEDSAGICSRELLQDFFLKNNQMYNEWLERERRSVKETMLKRLKYEAEKALGEKNYPRAEDLCVRLLKMDEFDEYAYRQLIEIYQADGEYARAIALYEKMEKMFAGELAAEPSAELRSLIEEIKGRRRREFSAFAGRKNPGQGQLAFFGRERETDTLSGELADFIAGNGRRAVVVTGEGGVGKTFLIRNVLSSCLEGDPLVLSSACHRTEEKYLLKPWHNILKRLLKEEGDTKFARLTGAVSSVFPFIGGEIAGEQKDYFSGASYRNIEKSIVSLLLEAAAKKRLILFFDDLQWSDEMTISLIRSVMTSDDTNSIYFMITYKEEAASTANAERFIGNMKLAGLMRELPLRRFGFDETVTMMNCLLPNHEFPSGFDARFYEETGGSPFFIVEMANHIKESGALGGITPNIRDVIKNRIGYLSLECAGVLEHIAIFLGGVSFDTLVRFSRRDELELAEIIAELIGKQFLREEEQPDCILLVFTHQKIPEYIYANMPRVKKRLLHSRAGLCLEEGLAGGKEDMMLYPRLIYHFERGAMKIKYLKYTVKYVHSYMAAAHEYFPVVDASVVKDDGRSLRKLSESVGATMDSTVNKVAQLLQALVLEQGEDFRTWDAETHEVVSDCLHLTGRYQILNCCYDEGVRSITRLKEINAARRTPREAENMEKANKQLLYIHINRGDPGNMLAIIDETIPQLPPSDREKAAVWRRMRGMGRIMSGRLDEGTSDLQAAIEVFKNCGDKHKYIYNLAASHAWLGEAKRHAFDHIGAAECYARAVETMSALYWAGGGATFYTYAGMNAFDSGNFAAAERNLKQALLRYDRVTLLWGRGLAHAYCALLSWRNGRRDDVLSHLPLALKNAEKLDSNYERGVIDRVKAQIAASIGNDCRTAEFFASVLTGTSQELAERAERCLSGVFSPVDRKYLRELKYS